MSKNLISKDKHKKKEKSPDPNSQKREKELIYPILNKHKKKREKKGEKDNNTYFGFWGNIREEIIRENRVCKIEMNRNPGNDTNGRIMVIVKGSSIRSDKNNFIPNFFWLDPISIDILERKCWKFCSSRKIIDKNLITGWT